MFGACLPNRAAGAAAKPSGQRRGGAWKLRQRAPLAGASIRRARPMPGLPACCMHACMHAPGGCLERAAACDRAVSAVFGRPCRLLQLMPAHQQCLRVWMGGWGTLSPGCTGRGSGVVCPVHLAAPVLIPRCCHVAGRVRTAACACAQIRYDMQDEKPVWVLSCYSHRREGHNDLTGGISFEEARWSNYQVGPMGGLRRLGYS